MVRRKDFFEEYASDSSSGSGDDDEGDVIPTDDGGHRPKRRRTKNAKEDAALGVFGSDDDSGDGNGKGKAWKSKTLRNKGVGFVTAGAKVQDDDEDEDNTEDGFAEFADTVGLGFDKPQSEEETDEETPARPVLGAKPNPYLQTYEEESAERRDRTRQETWWEEESVPSLGLGSVRPAFAAISKASKAKAAGLSSTVSSGASTPHHVGLGFAGSSRPSGFTPAGTPAPFTPSFTSPFGQGFVSSASKAAAAMPKFNPNVVDKDDIKVVRPSAFTPASTPADGKKGKKRTDSANATPVVNPDSFAARMMATMGYKAGQGLGREGQGRLEPIATKLRPQGVGVGAVKEMSEQEKKEMKRIRELKGEVVSDSDDEKKKKEARRKKAASGGSTPRGTKRERTKFRTAEEISAGAEGLAVPNVLKSIIDYTGREKKLLTSASGLMQVTVTKDDQATRLAKMARRDLETFASEWKTLQDRKAFLAKEEERLADAVDEQEGELKRLQEMVEISKQLQTLSNQPSSSDMGEDEILEALVTQLEVLQAGFTDVDPSHLQDITVAALAPSFKSVMVSWDPLTNPNLFVSALSRLTGLLAPRTRVALEASYAVNGYLEHPKIATPYESLLANSWLPRVRAALNTWDCHDPTPALTLLQVWTPLLPFHLLSSVLSHLIVPKLTTALSMYNPKPRKRHRVSPAPHLWILPWLPQLSALDTVVLLPVVKSKLSTVLSSHDISTPHPEGLDLWTSVPGLNLSAVLTRYLLPRLASHLRSRFTVNPADQDLAPLEEVLAYAPLFTTHVLEKLLAAEVFPMWLHTLHSWLTSPGCRLDEVQQWYMFWTEVLPQTAGTRAEFSKGLDMMNAALDLGQQAAAELPAPAAGPIRFSVDDKKKRDPPRKKASPEPETTFRDVVEDWCADQDLLLVPLRKAHDATGSPLFRITESASGKGGVVVYFRGDVVWAQDRKEREKWEPTALEEVGKRVIGS